MRSPFFLILVLLFCSCEQEQPKVSETTTVSYVKREGKTNFAIFKEMGSLWSRGEVQEFDSSNIATRHLDINNFELLYVVQPRQDGNFMAYVEPSDSILIQVIDKKAQYSGSSQAVRRNNFYSQFREVQGRYNEYQKELYLLNYQKQKGVEVQELPPFDMEALVAELHAMIEEYQVSHKDYSKAFVDFLKIEAKYFGRKTQLDMPRILNKTYHDFNESQLTLLMEVVDDAQYESAILSPSYKECLMAYVDYLRVHDPESKKGHGLEFMENEVRLGNYFSHQLISDFVVASNLHQFVDHFYADETLKELISNHAGSWSAFLTDETAKYRERNKNHPGGRKVPELPMEDKHGQKVNLSDFKGKWVYLDIWATWCGPCNFEIPYTHKLEGRMENNNVVFVGVSVDKESDREKWSNFIEEHAMGEHQLICYDKDAVYEQFGVTGIPHYAIIDPEGNLYLNNAPRPSSGVAEDLLSALGSEKPLMSKR